MNKQYFFLRLAAISGALAVAIGAFGAHLLRDRLSPKSMEIFHTASQYHFYHSLALMGAGLLFINTGSRRILLACRLFTAGILIFSGSLYTLAMAEQLRWLGMITPLGGICFIAGWLMVFAGLSGRK